MKGLSKKNIRSFQEYGRSGGKKRARHLSSERRSAIAAHAAKVRWKRSDSKNSLLSVRFDFPQLGSPAFLEEMLVEGTLSDWRQIYQRIADHPFGPTAQALEKALLASHAYGVIPLWKGILRTVQGNFL